VKLALFTTIYPGVEPYLADWLRSVREQSDRECQIWIGLDALSVEAACEAMGGDPGARWLAARSGETPAQLRQRIWLQMLPTCDGIVMVDSDDVLAPSRIEAARAALAGSDLAGCALRLVDENGRAIGPILGAASGDQATAMLPRHNVFGLSNTAYRSDLVRRCLPLPPGLVIVDWYLATAAWQLGARLDFDPVPRMDYRQHGNNMTQVVGPFTADRVARDTAYARQHFRLLAAHSGLDRASQRGADLARVAADIERFQERVVADPANLRRYVASLNTLDLPLIWWICVAHPSLADMWRPASERN
jgi:hypothetical protein